jgi:hypothetical protein
LHVSVSALCDHKFPSATSVKVWIPSVPLASTWIEVWLSNQTMTQQT